MGRSIERMREGVFICGTDTGVGKTIVSLGIALALQKMGIDVGAMKPVQCGGNDARFLKDSLKLKDRLSLINPYYARGPFAPTVAFKEAGIRINPSKINSGFKELKERHKFVIVEGVGGLIVPIKKDYFVSDLIFELGLPLIIVSRPGLGTINHTLLTVKAAKERGLTVLGIIINGLDRRKAGIPEKTNPGIIEELGGVPILGIVPFLKDIRTIGSAVLDNVAMEKIIEKPKEERVLPWADWDKKYLWHPFTQMQNWLRQEPLIVEEARGCYLKDTKGRCYIDGVSSLWVNIHGHRKKHIDEAIMRQLNKVAHTTLLGLGNIPSIELAKKLTRVAPAGLKKVFYSDTGAAAVEIALKIAFQYWQNTGRKKKTKFIHLKNAYHGDTIGAMSVGGIGKYQQTYSPLLFESFEVESPYCYRCAKNKNFPGCNFACLDELKRALSRRNPSIAALIIEPVVQAAAGIIVWPTGALRIMRRLCRKYNVLFIADEVATGFGRTGKMFACEQERVVPDILCLAKGLSGGYLPIAATLTTQEIYGAFLGDYSRKTFFHGHTYTGNPLACASALANLELFKREKTLDKLQKKIRILQKGLLRFKGLDYVGDIRQKGFMAGIELVEDKSTKRPFPQGKRVGAAVCRYALRYGVILRPLGDVIVLMPPLAISTQDLLRLIDAVYNSIRAVTSKNT